MALVAPPSAERKRVKVYELKNNDWFDRGTGFCVGILNNEEARIHVQSEDEPDRTLLETRITKDDGYQKQQDTLIVWTEQNVTDMALSFQEAEGCAAIWDFVSESQQKLGLLNGVDDGLSDDIIDSSQALVLPEPDIGNLHEIENTMRLANNTTPGREALAKLVVSQEYIAKLVPLVQIAEDFESLTDLHRLCNIMKTIILLNDNAIMEQAVRNDLILGVVGALEYDPDFPSHKANHRKYLSDASRFKQVVNMEDKAVEQKIHHTYRLQYLKDVVLARIIDDPTFSVLNSLIYFNQIEIVQHVQTSLGLLKELFGIFRDPSEDPQKKKNAVLFIQQCCSIAKGLQQPGRTGLFNNFVTAGLFHVITFALKHSEPQVRTAGTEILMALIDHDNHFLRGQIFKALNEKQKPLTDTLIELLLQEPDLGVKAQMGDALKILLDPVLNIQSLEHQSRQTPELMSRNSNMLVSEIIQTFYDDSSKKLFAPLREIKNRTSMKNLTSVEASLYAHLTDALTYFLRQHSYRTKTFLQAYDLNASVAQLFRCPEKFLKLAALKYFRSVIAMGDQWHWQQMIHHKVMEPILDTMLETMPKDNLVNSACLDLFEFVRRGDHLRDMVAHLMELYREKMENLSYMETMKSIIIKYEQMTAPVPDELSFTTVETDPAPNKLGPGAANGRPYQGLQEDPDEEAYFNGDEGDEEDGALSPTPSKTVSDRSSPLKPLVDYPDDDDDEDELALSDPVVLPSNGVKPSSDDSSTDRESSPSTARSTTSPPSSGPAPPERLAEKRRREDDDDDDELGRLVSQPPKRRLSGAGPPTGSIAKGGHTLRRKKGLSVGDNKKKEGKIAISLAVKASDGPNGDS